MHKRLAFTKPLLLVLVILSFIPATTHAQYRKSSDSAGVKKYTALMEMIRYAYVDTVNEPKLVEKAIIETLRDLDPHSSYISKKDLERANEPLVGNFDGIGVQFEILRDTINIVHAVPGGPSEKLGITPGDKIIRIEGEIVVGKKISTQFVLDHLRGKKGTKVTVSIFRKGHKDLIDYTITRDKIPITSVDAAYMITSDAGYINLNRFSATSMQEISEAMQKLKMQGMKNLILDLRNNSGGFMNVAIDLSDEFLPPNKSIVYTQGVHSPRDQYTSTVRGSFEKGKLVIMINENSASASEIVSGAIQDHDRGIIVGRRSFGKGLVQRPFDLPDGSQVRLTTARYFTPSGRCIQKSYSEGTDKYEMDFINRIKHGELVNPDSIKFPDSLKYYTDNRRVVYGGGGIMPDVFTAWDSTPITDFYMDVRRRNVVNLFVGDYVDRQRANLNQSYPDFKTFFAKFAVEDSLWYEFLSIAEKEGVKRNEKEEGLSEELLKAQIKSLIAQKLWDLNSSVAVMNRYDREVQKAIEVINNDALFTKLKISR
jgi:carboxyl-terminal processing protease